MPRKLHVSILGKSEIIREGLRRILTDQDFVVDETESSCAAFGELTCDVIIVDAHEAEEGIQSCVELRERFSDCRIVLMMDQYHVEDVARAFATGAVDGYLVKAISCAPLAAALRLVAMGQKVMPSEMAASLTDVVPQCMWNSRDSRLAALPVSDRETGNSAMPDQWRPEQGHLAAPWHRRGDGQGSRQGDPAQAAGAEPHPGSDLGSQTGPEHAAVGTATGSHYNIGGNQHLKGLTAPRICFSRSSPEILRAYLSINADVHRLSPAAGMPSAMRAGARSSRCAYLAARLRADRFHASCRCRGWNGFGDFSVIIQSLMRRARLPTGSKGSSRSKTAMRQSPAARRLSLAHGCASTKTQRCYEVEHGAERVATSVRPFISALFYTTPIISPASYCPQMLLSCR